MRRSGIFFSLLLIITSCSSDQYDTGDGPYSYLRADFVRAHCISSGEFNYAVTDDGDSLLLQPYATVSWSTKTDSTYRALLYYNKQDQTATPVQLSAVPIVYPISSARPDTLHTDPMIFESAWVSKNGRYLNVGYGVKTGRTDGSDQLFQIIGMNVDSTVVDSQGKKHIYLTMLHNQNGVPEYYTVHGYFSIPLTQSMKPAVFSLNFHTYGGAVRKELKYD